MSEDAKENGPKTADDWNQEYRRQQAIKLMRENAIAEGRYIEIEIAVQEMSDVVNTVWLATQNLANSIPQRATFVDAEQKAALRKLIVEEINFAKGEVEKYLLKLQTKLSAK